MKPKCDCLNECGDDSRVAAGTAAKCGRYDQVQRNMWQMRTAATLQNCMTPAARDVLQERRRQVEVEGWTPTHDDMTHLPDELALAACCYCVADENDAPPAVWPWATEWWKPKDRRRNMVRAAALLLAEIERLDRTA